MTFDEQVNDEYDKLDWWIKELRRKPKLLGHQSGNPNLIMTLEYEVFQTGYTHLDLTPALPVIKFVYERRREIQRGERYKYWFEEVTDIDDIINKM